MTMEERTECICPQSKVGFILWSETCLIYMHRLNARWEADKARGGLFKKGDL